jgi:hypothetical protein
MLNGKVLTIKDIESTFTNLQKEHGKTLDVYAPIMRDNIQYPSIADQWKADAARRFTK